MSIFIVDSENNGWLEKESKKSVENPDKAIIKVPLFAEILMMAPCFKDEIATLFEAVFNSSVAAGLKYSTSSNFWEDYIPYCNDVWNIVFSTPFGDEMAKPTFWYGKVYPPDEDYALAHTFTEERYQSLASAINKPKHIILAAVTSIHSENIELQFPFPSIPYEGSLKEDMFTGLFLIDSSTREKYTIKGTFEEVALLGFITGKTLQNSEQPSGGEEV